MSDLADELTKALAGNTDEDQGDEQEQEQEQEEPGAKQEEPGSETVDKKQEEAPAEGDKEEAASEPPPYVKSIPKEEVEDKSKEEASDDDRILLSYLKDQLGEDLTGKYNTDDDMLLGLVNASKMVGKREEDAQKWRALAAAPEETLASWGYTREQAQQQAQQAQQQVQQAQQQTQQQQAVQKVEFEDAWMQMVERDEQGQITGTKPGVDPAIAGKLKKAEEYATKQYRDMIFNPEKIISPMLEREREKIREEITSSMQSEMQQQQITNQAWGYLSDEQNKAWLFNNGDMQSGLSPDGIRFKGYVDEAASRGLNPNDINGLVQYATDKMEVDWYRSQQGQQQQKPKRSPGPPAANVSQPDETDIDTERREGETLEESMFRLAGVDPMAGRR